MALAKDSKRTPFHTNVLKESKETIKELSDRTGIPISRLVDIAIQDLYEKCNNEGLTVKMGDK